jgi:hypothetical protein
MATDLEQLARDLDERWREHMYGLLSADLAEFAPEDADAFEVTSAAEFLRVKNPLR